MSMEEDYRRDQEAIRTLYAAARALEEVKALHRPHSKAFIEKVDDIAATCVARAEQIQSVWN